MTPDQSGYQPALAVRLFLAGGATALVYQSGCYEAVSRASDCEWAPVPLSGFEKAEACLRDLPPSDTAIRICALRPGAPIRVTETRQIMIRVDGEAVPSLRNQQRLRVSTDKDFISFKFVNYLGRAHVFFQSGEDLLLEVVPEKISYEDDYRSLTEDIASRCAELLLDDASPTANQFSPDGASKPMTLLSRFMFIRQLACPGVIEGIFEEIRSNPDRKLIRLREMVPYGTAAPSPKVFTSPLAHASSWHLQKRGAAVSFVPGFHEADRKEDSIDTEANRFVKFALGVFKKICSEVALKSEISSQNRIEAADLKARIERIENSAFFKKVGRLRVMPSGNQVLQKRSGYRRILQILALCAVAPSLKWDGHGQVFEGEARNIALLYEYWLFFELNRIIRMLPGCTGFTPVEQDDCPAAFMKESSGGLAISLKEGAASRQSFKVAGLGDAGLCLNLYYNRTFRHCDFDGTRYEGSYSTIFRPDFTIAIFPSDDGTEAQAVRNGRVVFLHFDAKYRLDRQTLFRDGFGFAQGEPSAAADSPEAGEEEDRELDEEETEAVEHVYRRGDLLKMHTYRDAIRRTVGCYILYPWTPPAPAMGEKGIRLDSSYRIYSEIIPGVGAFAYSPSNRDAARQAVFSFISDVVRLAMDGGKRQRLFGNSLALPLMAFGVDQGGQIVLGEGIGQMD